MKRVIRKLLSVSTAVLISAFFVANCGISGVVSAASTTGCPSNQAPTSSGGCCDIGHVQISDTGAVTCQSSGGPGDCASTATDINLPNNNNPQDPTACLFSTYINPAIALLSAAVGVTVVAVIVYGAIEITSSGGDPQRAAAGKNRIRDALVGLAAYLLLFAFLQFIIPGGLL